MRSSDIRASGPAVLGLAFAAGAIPYSGWAARLIAGVDLRSHGSGTVSGTGLYDVAGFGPLAVAGTLDVAKGALGPILAGRDRPKLRALAAGLTITGHNWSPALGGAGGRGISPALGSLLAIAPEGVLVLGAGLGGGRLVHQSGLGTALALVALFPLLGYRRGRDGIVLATSIAVPMLLKRVLGNHPPRGRRVGRTIATRLLFDRDPDPGQQDRRPGERPRALRLPRW